jgi:hypothetical protein
MIPYIWTTVFPLIIVQYLLPSVVARNKVVRDVQAKMATGKFCYTWATGVIPPWRTRTFDPGLQPIVQAAPFSDLPGKDNVWQHPLMWDIRKVSIAQIYSG